MKLINKFIVSLSVAALALGGASCTGDLDLTPTDPRSLTAGDFSKDPKGYMEAVMADIYMQFATYGANGNSPVSGFDGGMATFQRAAFILEEIPTDEADWIASADADYGMLQYGISQSGVKFVEGTYARFLINVTLCNDFIQTVQGGYFHLNTPELEAEGAEFIRQAKIMRSLAYFYLIDCFGNVPYADENTPTGSVPAQLSRAEVYNNVVTTLEEVVAEYGDNAGKAPYGYVGVDAARALLVKYYLNAEVYTGQSAWDKCYNAAQKVIARLGNGGYQGSGLAQHYAKLFAVNNNECVLGGAGDVDEIIIAVIQDQPKLTSWANGTFMVDAWLGDNGVYDGWKAQFNTTDGWKCATMREECVRNFFDFDANWNSPDVRVANWLTENHGFNIENTALDQEHYGNNGFIPMKFTNWAIGPDGNIDRDASPTASNQNGIDYPVIRLAEVYLSAAEAALKGGGDRATGLRYVNLVRGRAGLQPWLDADFNYNSLQAERCRELYTENCRRTDLIRYGKWISGYNWSWKNNSRYGSDFPAYNTLYPLPSSIVTLTGYKQNPGY